MVNRLIGNLSCMLTMAVSLLRLAAAIHEEDTRDVPVLVPVPAQEASQDYDKFLIGCIEKVSPKCGEELVATVNLENVAVTDECCEEILAMGKACHDILVMYIAEDIEGGSKFKGNEAMYMKEGTQMWKKCAFSSTQVLLHASS